MKPRLSIENDVTMRIFLISVEIQLVPCAKTILKLKVKKAYCHDIGHNKLRMFTKNHMHIVNSL